MANENQKLSEMQVAIRDAVKAAVGETIREAVPMAVLAAQSSQRSVDDQKELDLAKARASFGAVCHECGQAERACKGKHTQMVVYPPDDSYAEWFTGLFLNGVKYLSDHGGHAITVPEQNDFAHMLNMWCKSEREMRQGRKRNASANAVHA
jgi:hypothetical protein